MVSPMAIWPMPTQSGRYGPMKGTTTCSGVYGTLRSIIEHGAVDEGERQADGGQVLVQRERHGAMGDAIEDLRR